jgi:hypothetical protein
MSESTSHVPDSQVAGLPTPAEPQSSADQARGAVAAQPRLRLWPGVLIVALQWVFITLAQIYAAGTMIQFYAMFMGPMVGGALFAGWWLFASRLPWKERWLGLFAGIGSGVAAMLLAHPTLGGMAMGVFALPAITLAAAAWLLVTQFMRWPIRRTGLLAVLLLLALFALNRQYHPGGKRLLLHAQRCAIQPPDIVARWNHISRLSANDSALADLLDELINDLCRLIEAD